MLKWFTLFTMFILLLSNPSIGHYGARFEPPDGMIYHGSGWNYIDSQQIYEDMFAGDRRPLILQVNVSIPGTRGVDVARTVQALTRPIVHEDSQFVEYSMHFQGRDALVMLDSVYVYTNEWDRYVDTLEIAFRQVDRPFFFRIGFEFNGSWNPYHPYILPQAFRKLVLELRRRGIDNFATVWCYEPDAAGDFADSTRQGWKWYPGDDVVDWFGLDLFNHEHFDPAQPDSQRGQLSRKGKSEAFLRFAHLRGKPVYLSELSAIDISVTPDSSDVDSADGRNDWESWFEPFFEFVEAHAGIKGWNYIDVDWNVVGHYGEQGWRDARLEINSYIRNRWVERVSGERFIHAGYDITQPASVGDEEQLQPLEMDLSVFPNPFNASLNIEYNLSRPGLVSLQVMDVDGRLIRVLSEGWQPAGVHRAVWEAEDFPSGIYFCVLKSSDRFSALKAVLVR